MNLFVDKRDNEKYRVKQRNKLRYGSRNVFFISASTASAIIAEQFL